MRARRNMTVGSKQKDMWSEILEAGSSLGTSSTASREHLARRLELEPASCHLSGKVWFVYGLAGCRIQGAKWR
jgi:hypothetical protein